MYRFAETPLYTRQISAVKTSVEECASGKDVGAGDFPQDNPGLVGSLLSPPPPLLSSDPA